MSVVNDRGQLTFESQEDFNEWLLTRIIVLQSILADQLGMTKQDFDSLHAQGQAHRDQKAAEEKMKRG